MGSRRHRKGAIERPDTTTEPIATDVAATPEPIDATPAVADDVPTELVGTETRADAEANDADALKASIAAAVALLESNGYVARQRTAATRVLMPKADPNDVRAYFDSTGLARKDLAAICNVTSSVISTVQNVNGDRWSLVTFAVKKGLIDAELARRAAAANAAIDAALAATAEVAATEPTVEVAQVA